MLCSPANHPPTLLNVDDNAMSRIALSQLLRAAGFEVWEAATALEGLRLAAAGPDVVILDVVLPDLDGFEVCRRIKADPATAATPVLMVSGAAVRTEDRVHGLEGGADGYLTKPVEPAELVAHLKALLRVRQAEHALRESEARYRALFEANPHPMWVYDLQTLAFLAVNDAAVGLYRYAREEFLRMTITDIRPPEDVPALQTHMARPTPEQQSSGIWRHRRKDGSLLHVEVSSHAFTYDGRPGRLVLAHDVTERLRAEEARNRLTAILEATTDLVAITQGDGPALYLNAAGRRMLGAGAEEPVTLSERRPTWARAVIADEAIPTALRDGVWSGETAFLSKVGQEIPVWQVLVAHRNPGGAVEFLSTIARDVTAHKRLEEQLRQAQKMEAIGQLAGGIAHDFNNLLTVITGYSEVLLNDPHLDDPAREMLREVRSAGERSASLTRQLLAFSRRQVLAPKVLDLNAVVLDTEKLLRRIIGEDIALATALHPGLGAVYTDPGQLEQVIINLVVNARDAMPQGGRLTLETADVEFDESYTRTRADVQPGTYVLLSMSDTGCGMDAATKARIFEPFFTTKEPGKGTGLGLATVYGIVKQSGGHIEVYSEPGVGSTFKIYLPRVVQATRPVKSLPGLREGPSGSETVLLVEDEQAVRALTRHVLQTSGYTVLEASHGDEALRICQEHRGAIHLLLTDVVMPGMGGRQLAERLLASHPGIRVLFMSGYTDDAIVRHGVLEAETQFLQKPFSPLALAQKVREVLDSPVVHRADV